MALRDELLAESASVVKHEIDGKAYRFKQPNVDAEQRVMNAGGLTALPQFGKTKAKGERRLALGRMKVQALIETLLDDGEGERKLFTQADEASLMAAPLGSKIARLADFAFSLFKTADDEQGDDEAPQENPSPTTGT